MKRVVIDIRASKNISGLVKVSVTSPAGLMKFFLNVEPWRGLPSLEGKNELFVWKKRKKQLANSTRVGRHFL